MNSSALLGHLLKVKLQRMQGFICLHIQPQTLSLTQCQNSPKKGQAAPPGVQYIRCHRLLRRIRRLYKKIQVVQLFYCKNMIKAKRMNVIYFDEPKDYPGVC